MGRIQIPDGPPDATGAADRGRTGNGRTTFERTVASVGVLAMTLVVVLAAINLGVGISMATEGATQGTIDKCQTINSSGTYTLGKDITDYNTQGHDSKDICFFITADGVTLDGNGHSIEIEQTAIMVKGDGVTVEDVVVDGSSGLNEGIEYAHASDGEIKNNEIRDVSTAIAVTSGRNTVVKGNTVEYASSYGIRFYSGGREHEARNNDVESSTTGILVETGATDVDIRDNTVTDNSQGGIEVTTDDNVVVGNTVKDNSHFGVSVDTGDGNEVRDNEVLKNRNHGINLDGATNNDVLANTVEDNNGDGIHLYASDDNLIKNNDVTRNYDGIELSSSNKNEISDNLVADNTENGTYVRSRSDSNGFFHNDFENNQDHGIALVDAGGNEFVDNSALDNGKAAFYSEGNGANDAQDLRIGTSSDPVTVGFEDAVSVVIDTTTKPPDGPNPDEWADESDDSGDIGDDELVETPLLDPDVQTALTETNRRLAEIMNVSDKAQIQKYVRVRPTHEVTDGPASPKLDGLKIYYDNDDLNCNYENELQIWRFSPPSNPDASGVWRPNVGKHRRGSSGSSVQVQQFGTISVTDKTYVELYNNTDTNGDLVSFQFVDYHVFAAMSDQRSGCTPTAYTQPTEDEGSPGFGIVAALVALVVVLSRRLLDGS